MNLFVIFIPLHDKRDIIRSIFNDMVYQIENELLREESLSIASAQFAFFQYIITISGWLIMKIRHIRNAGVRCDRDGHLPGRVQWYLPAV
jgi:hypothetical protein